MERDKLRLESKKLTKRQKARILTAEQVTTPALVQTGHL